MRARLGSSRYANGYRSVTLHFPSRKGRYFFAAGGRAANALRTASGKWLPYAARPVASFARRMEFDRAGSARGQCVQHDMVLIVPKGALFFDL